MHEGFTRGCATAAYRAGHQDDGARSVCATSAPSVGEDRVLADLRITLALGVQQSDLATRGQRLAGLGTPRPTLRRGSFIITQRQRCSCERHRSTPVRILQNRFARATQHVARFSDQHTSERRLRNPKGVLRSTWLASEMCGLRVAAVARPSISGCGKQPQRCPTHSQSETDPHAMRGPDSSVDGGSEVIGTSEVTPSC